MPRRRDEEDYEGEMDEGEEDDDYEERTGGRKRRRSDFIDDAAVEDDEEEEEGNDEDDEELGSGRGWKKQRKRRSEFFDLEAQVDSVEEEEEDDEAEDGGDSEGSWFVPDILVNIMMPGEGSCIAVIREVLMDGTCKVAIGSSGDGDIITAHPTDVEAVRPKRSEKIKIMNGALRGITGKLIGVDGADGIVKMDDNFEVKILDMNMLAKLAIQ